MVSDPLPGSIFRSLVHFAPDGILVVDRSGTIVFANAQAEALFGYSREELAGMPVEALMPERFRIGHQDLRAGYTRAPRPRPMGSRMALSARRRDGSEFPVEISLAPVYTDDGALVSAIVRDVTEQRELEEERRDLLAEAEIERERNRIAADLHDGVMQAMYSVGLQLTSFLRRAASLSDEERERVSAAIEGLDRAISDVRKYVQDLHPAEFDGDLGSSLEELVDTVQATSGIEVSFTCDPELPELVPAAAFELFLIAREALSNVQRHSGATSAAVSLEVHGDALDLRIRDDGAGFDTSLPPAEEHFGLRNMRRRADAVGARLTIESTPDTGTEVCVRVPLGDRSRPD